MRVPSMTTPRRRMLAAGRLGRWRYDNPCGPGHVGPWVPAPEYGDWARRLATQVGAPIQPGEFGQCMACQSHDIMPEASR